MEGQPSPSPLSALGLAHLDGPDLLQEKLEGQTAPELPAEGEREPQRRSPDFKDIKDAWRESQRERKEPKSNDNDPDDNREDLEEDLKDSDDLEKSDPDSSKSLDKKEKKEDFEGFHVLNDEMQRQRQDFQNFTQQQAQREEQMQQWLYKHQQAAQPPQPKIEDALYQELGLQDAAPLYAYKDAILAQARQEQQALYQQQIMPMLVQQQRDRFDLAINRQKEALPQFDKYFNRQALNQLHETLIKTHGINNVAAINWDQQLAQAYQSADYPRLKAQLEKLEKTGKKETETKDKKKEQQKEKLGLVPKASVDNSGPGFDSWKKDIDKLPSSLSFRSFGREALKVLSSKRA
jgi:hypothetical protein